MFSVRLHNSVLSGELAEDPVEGAVQSSPTAGSLHGVTLYCLM